MYTYVYTYVYIYILHLTVQISGKLLEFLRLKGVRSAWFTFCQHACAASHSSVDLMPGLKDMVKSSFKGIMQGSWGSFLIRTTKVYLVICTSTSAYTPLRSPSLAKHQVVCPPRLTRGCQSRYAGQQQGLWRALGSAQECSSQNAEVHSSKLTWKLRGAPIKTTVLYKGLSMSFHVNLGD